MRSAVTVLALVCACRGSSSAPATADSAPPDAAALETLARSCEAGDAAVCSTLAAMYLVGKDAPIDPARSRELRRRATDLYLARCTKGDKAACAELPYVTVDPPTPLPAPGPEPGHEVMITAPTLSIVITVDGDLILDGRVLAEPELNAELARGCREAGVQAIVASDAVVQYGKVIRMIDLLRENGCQKWALAVQKG